MKITWLGQAGLLFETDGKKIVIDPYLSNNVTTVNPKNYRRVPVNEEFLALRPDVIICTHDHLDHVDKETLKYYFTSDAKMLVLAPSNAWDILRQYKGDSNYVRFNPGTTWTEGKVTLRAVYAEHSDPTAIGVILTAEGRNYYITGDTLYSERVFESLPDLPLKAVFLPINGVGNNMNATDASAFAARTGATYAVPLHFGLFDNLDPHAFTHPRRVIPEFYQEICFED
ncbi:MAG: MBL fold metallo-hydrolase [Clostridia bacterium]|nr:MBL fold metallo-hydrolase [Clostridia bacterium]